MQTPEVVQDTPVLPEPSFSDLRKMFNSSDAGGSDSAEVNEPANVDGEAAGDAISESDSGADDKQERGADGKFKAAKQGEDEESDENLSAGVRKRIDKERWKRGELERENAELKAKLANQDTEPAKQKTAPAATKDDPRPVRPKLSDFENYEEYDAKIDEYQEQLTDWKVREVKRKDAAEAEETRRREVAETQTSTWKSREADFVKAHSDYETKLKTLEFPDSPAVPAVRQALLESEVGPAVLYHLASNPDQAKALLALSAASAVRELGKIEAQISPKSTPETETRKTTNAPKPPAKVADGSGAAPKAVDPKDLDKMSMKDFKRAVPKLLGK
jgi:hypothetical protein